MLTTQHALLSTPDLLAAFHFLPQGFLVVLRVPVAPLDEACPSPMFDFWRTNVTSFLAFKHDGHMTGGCCALVEPCSCDPHCPRRYAARDTRPS